MLVISAGPKPGESRETEEKTQRTKACDHRDRLDHVATAKDRD